MANPRGLTLRSTGRAGTWLLGREHRRGAPVTSNVRPTVCAAQGRIIHSTFRKPSHEDIFRCD
jgi:hypothetical protein